jgi:hypothetical protein
LINTISNHKSISDFIWVLENCILENTGKIALIQYSKKVKRSGRSLYGPMNVQEEQGYVTVKEKNMQINGNTYKARVP